MDESIHMSEVEPMRNLRHTFKHSADEVRGHFQFEIEIERGYHVVHIHARVDELTHHISASFMEELVIAGDDIGVGGQLDPFLHVF